MTGDQSRTLRVGDRVRWGATTTDLGTVVETSWSGVPINWDDGHMTSIQHNDLSRVERCRRIWGEPPLSGSQEQTQIIASAIGKAATKATVIVKVNAVSKFSSGRTLSTAMLLAPLRGRPKAVTGTMR
jgi:hypothetical protein